MTEVLQAPADTAYQNHLRELERYVETGRVPYPIDRPLVGENSYRSFLPNYCGRDETGNQGFDSRSFLGITNELIGKRLEQAEEMGVPYEPVVVMDIGPGNFQALLDARDRWGDYVELVGVGPDVLQDFDGVDCDRRQIWPTRSAVRAAGITALTGSVTTLSDNLPEALRPDVILSCHALQYTDMPLWETIARQVYGTLKPDGFAFLAFAPPNISSGMAVFAETEDHFAHAAVTKAMNKRYRDDLSRLHCYLWDRGYHFEIRPVGNLACQKVMVGGSYDLPQGIRTIIQPSAQDLGLEDDTAWNPRVAYWCENYTARYPKYLSLHPAMEIPASS